MLQNFSERFWRILSFQASVFFLYPLKTSDNLWFSDVFKVYRKETLNWKS